MSESGADIVDCGSGGHVSRAARDIPHMSDVKGPLKRMWRHGLLLRLLRGSHFWGC